MGRARRPTPTVGASYAKAAHPDERHAHPPYRTDVFFHVNRAIALFALLAIACVPATQPAESVVPASAPAARPGDDLVYLAVQDGATQGATIVAMPSGRVLAHVEGYAYASSGSFVGPRVALFTSSAVTPDGASVKIARVELTSGRATTLDLGALKMSGVTIPPFPAVVGTADGARILVAYTSVDDAIARTQLELLDEGGARLASRAWTETLPDDAGSQLRAWTRLVPLGADRFLLVRSLWRTGKTRETWSVLDADLRQLATRSSDLGWAQGSRGPRPTTNRDEDLLWSSKENSAILIVRREKQGRRAMTRAARRLASRSAMSRAVSSEARRSALR